MLALHDVYKQFGKEAILKNINMTVGKGEIVGLVGPNGAGKTTLMKILNGLIVNYKGEVKKNRNVGALIESPKCIENKSGLYNLKYFGALYGDKQRVPDLIQRLNMESYQNKRVKHYSVGMKQRLGIALALIGNPDFLVLDEPTSGMDPGGGHEIIQYLKWIAKKNNMGILVSSHILTDIEGLCDRVYLMHEGQIKNEHRPFLKFYIKGSDSAMTQSILSGVQDVMVKGQWVYVQRNKAEQVSQLLHKYNVSFEKTEDGTEDLKDSYFSMIGEKMNDI